MKSSLHIFNLVKFPNFRIVCPVIIVTQKRDFSDSLFPFQAHSLSYLIPISFTTLLSKIKVKAMTNYKQQTPLENLFGVYEERIAAYV